MIGFKWLGTTVLLAMVLAGCGGGTGEEAAPEAAVEEVEVAPPTPEATLARMIELATAGDWEAYVDDYYGEQHKFRSDADRDQVVARFRDKWGAQVVEQLGSLAGVTAELVDDGARAEFKMDDGNAFYLYKDDSGNWTFHL